MLAMHEKIPLLPSLEREMLRQIPWGQWNMGGMGTG